MTFADAQTDWAHGLARALVDGGVRDVVVSPGSRSTPFLLAIIAQPALRVTTIVDERSAGFYALGQAKATGRPTALLCTSGTAGAHYYPAIIEASYAYVPLVAITADRPPELQGCGAPQTIDQQHLFGAHVRQFADLGVADPDGQAGMMRKVRQAVATAFGPTPGPVHINAPARKPLELTHSLAREGGAEWGYGGEAGPPLPGPPPGAREFRSLVEACGRAQRGLIVAGPAPVSARDARGAVAAFAKATGFPVLAESTSQLRHGADVPVIDGFDAILRSPAFAEAMAPDLIVQLGPFPVSSGWRDYAARHRGCERIVVAPHGWHDPQNAATAMIHADVGATLSAATKALEPRDGGAWAASFAAANDAAWRAAPDTTGMSEAAVTRAVLDALPPGAQLVLSNSNPVRAIDAFGRARAADLAVISQRGASGIDGLISSAAGAASTADAPTALLVGDVALSHDIAALAVAARATVPLAIVVVDNGGGRIFEQLPIARVPGIDAALREHWLTPPACDLAAAALSFGVDYASVTNPAALHSTLAAALDRRACTLVHAVVPGDAVTNSYRQLWTSVDAALRAQLGSRARGS